MTDLKTFDFEISSSDLALMVDKELTKKGNEVVIKGFRKGKAPLSMLKDIYGPEVEKRIFHDLISNKFKEAIRNQYFILVSSPQLKKVSRDTPGKIFFQIEAEVFPLLEVNDLESMSFDYQVEEIKEAEMKDLERYYLNSFAELVDCKDSEIIFEEGKVSDATLGERQIVLDFDFLPTPLSEFKEKFRGVKVGEAVQLEKVEIKIIRLRNKVIPSLSDEWVKSLNFDLKTVEEFQKFLKDSLLKAKEKKAQTQLKHDILDELVKKNPFEFPQKLLNLHENSTESDLQRFIILESLSRKFGINPENEEGYDQLNEEEMVAVRRGKEEMIFSELKKRVTVNSL